MFSELVKQISDDMQQKQDAWVLETLRKNGIYIKKDYTNDDLYFAYQLNDIKIERYPTSIDIYIGGVCRGQWFTNYEPKFEGDTYFLATKFWN